MSDPTRRAGIRFSRRRRSHRSSEGPGPRSPRPPAPSAFGAGAAHRLLSALVLLLVFAAGGTADRILWQGGAVAGASNPLIDRPEFQTLQATWDLIHEEWALPDEVDDQELIYGAAAGMVEALGDDGHSRFLDPELAQDFEEMTRGQFTGVGV